MTHSLKLSEIKRNIADVIANLQNLERLSNEPLNNHDVDQSHELQQRTTTLLSQLEELPCKQIGSIQMQRRRRRQRVKEKCKLQKRVNKADAKYLKDTKVICKPFAGQPSVSRTEKQAQHITLKKLHDATNILKTFDLLERLYKARGGDKDLGQKLARMRTVWRRVKQESENAKGVEAPANLEAQWDQVIFGSSSAPLKQRHGQKKQNIRELLQRR